ncbi:hypothetical protein N9Y75_04895 [Candidatus Poseidoniales archaeon]|nr:hypothetical protein [Candidatus Poseidoniales archaeon]MDB2672170.1 hypothetical protein [Candidatus Poseidoniales archaeon]
MLGEEKQQSPILDFLKKTKTQIADLSIKAANATKTSINTTSEAIQGKVLESKERSKKKKEAKIESLKNEIKDDGYIDLAPPMMVLPNVDTDQLNVLDAQTDAQIQIVEEMIRLSERVDSLERRILLIGKSNSNESLQNTVNESTEVKQVNSHVDKSTNVMIEVLNIMGASLLLLVSLFAVDGYLKDNEILLMEKYSLGIPLWTLGVFGWSLFLFQRMGKTGSVLRVPLLYRIQISLAIAMATMMGMLLSEESLDTISSAWIWTTVLASSAIIGVSMITSAWRMTKRMVGVKETVEVID